MDLEGVEIRRFQLSEPKDVLGRSRIYGHVHHDGTWAVGVHAESVHQMPTRILQAGNSVQEAIAVARQAAQALAVLEPADPGTKGGDGG
jgi:hypothetical protein